MFIEAKDDGGGSGNWTTGDISRANLQSNYHHQQTNIQFFTGWMPFLSPNQQCQTKLLSANQYYKKLSTTHIITTAFHFFASQSFPILLQVRLGPPKEHFWL